MLQIKILYIPDEEKLISLIKKSQGRVSFLYSGHVLYDLSQENADMKLLKEEIGKARVHSRQNGGKNVSRLSCAYRI